MTTIDSAVTERDTVASRCITGTDFSRVVEGKVAEHWAQFDGLGLLLQIGA